MLHKHTQSDEDELSAKRGTVAGYVKVDAIYKKRDAACFLCINKNDSILRRQNQYQLWFVFTRKIDDHVGEQKKED